jgi:hypothetical protein
MKKIILTLFALGCSSEPTIYDCQSSIDAWSFNMKSVPQGVNCYFHNNIKCYCDVLINDKFVSLHCFNGTCKVMQ